MATYIRLQLESGNAEELVEALGRRGFTAQRVGALLGRGEVLVRKPFLARTQRFLKELELAVSSWLIDSGVPRVRVRHADEEHEVQAPEVFRRRTPAGARA